MVLCNTLSMYGKPSFLGDMAEGSACCPFEGVTASPVVQGYRNHVNFTIGPTSDGQTEVGRCFASQFICYKAYVIRHASHFTRHTSRVTHFSGTIERD